MGGEDISCFAWDTGPNRRCSALTERECVHGSSISRHRQRCSPRSRVIIIVIFLKKIRSSAVSKSLMNLSDMCIEQHSLCVEAIDV